MADKWTTPVAVVGAGPVGLFTALRLAKAGIKVTVFESGSGIDQSPRAVAYFPAVLEEFSKAGILDEVVAAGEVNTEGCEWRDGNGGVIYELNAPPNDPNFVVCLSQPEFCSVVLEALLKTGNAEVLFNHSFKRLEQGNESVSYWIQDQANNGEVQGTCRYLVGTDGGRSTVRRSIGERLEGYTWESLQFIAVDFQYALKEHGWKPASYIVDPVNWGIFVKRGKGKSWRFATGVKKQKSERTDTLDEATINVVKDRLAHLLPGETSNIVFERFAPYTIHQRCVGRYRVGNVLLAGDSAHLNNPVGGLGLTTGLLDAAHLSGALQQILLEAGSPDLLDIYSEKRRAIFRDLTDPLSTENALRLMSENPIHVQKRDELFTTMRDPRGFPSIIQTGLADFALSSTSSTRFDTVQEVTWFISVTKPDGWANDKFQHEYKTVHRSMTKSAAEHGVPISQYVQLPNAIVGLQDIERPEWDYVTCLTFPSLFVLHAGFQNANYRATAGEHIFCKLDQKGCVARQVGKFVRGGVVKIGRVGAIRALIFHKRKTGTDEYLEPWFQERVAKGTLLAARDSKVNAYTLWEDMTPKSTEYLFKDTQFAAGSWDGYKAIEAFDIVDEASAAAFLERNRQEIVGESPEMITIVVGSPDVVF
ncbi:hypothetical protein ONS95_001137 [Cadophora gregata]|uniref:uncharacterized protein n=1 Tax=Cadophora gregata TaxID=51156 RepID=UPI0026DD19BB|nr:uncharacterized protein ONS95_001137 [Cadophora gregata]KAK0129202.1 hypothetical protein ONS95_001137 [Cadophora gregata]